MDSDLQSILDRWFPLPEGVKVPTHKFGKNAGVGVYYDAV